MNSQKSQSACLWPAGPSTSSSWPMRPVESNGLMSTGSRPYSSQHSCNYVMSQTSTLNSSPISGSPALPPPHHSHAASTLSTPSHSRPPTIPPQLTCRSDAPLTHLNLCHGRTTPLCWAADPTLSLTAQSTSSKSAPVLPQG